MAEISVGIDLGTTNSTASTCWPEGHPRLIRDEEGSGIIPSVVSFDESGDVLVGREAKLRMLTDLKNTFYSVKRFLGRDMRQDENRWAASQYPFTLKAGPNGIPMAVTQGREIPAFKISSHVIRYLKEMAEKSTGHNVTKVVLTVPANFNESQRKATKQAGEDAGMEILRIFNEPTAAALAYGLGKTTRETVAIYDFGGGTFDVTILRLEDPVFEVLATAGDTMLGGDDMDRVILDDMMTNFEGQYGFSPADDSTLRQRFLFGAERMKCQLSDWIVTAFEDKLVTDAGGKPLKPFHYELSRENFQNLVSKFGQKSLQVCDEAIREAGVKTSDISQVVLVGGTTRIPFLRKMVEDFFGRPPLDKIQPDVVVSIGASIQAYSLSGGDMVYPAKDSDLLPTKVYRLTDLPEDEFDDAADLSSVLEEEADEPRLKKSTQQMFVAPFEISKTDVRKEEVKAFEEAQTKARPSLSAEEAAGDPLEIKLSSDSSVDEMETVAQPKSKSLIDALKKKQQTVMDTETVVRKKPIALLDRFKEIAGKDLEDETVHQPPPPDLLDSTKGDPMEISAPDLDDPLAVAPLDESSGMQMKPAPFAAAADPMQVYDSDIEEIEEIEEVEEVEEVEEIPDIQVVSSQREGAEQIKKTLEQYKHDQPPAPVSPDDIAEPYLPKDILEQMDEVLQSELQEENNEVAPVEAYGEQAVAPVPMPAAIPRGTHAPLLLDVTPSTLSVATVGGFTEVIVKKNSQVPVEKSHMFTTSADFQEKAEIKILEGESNRADENNELGMIEILEIRPAHRGTIKIEVVFDISVDGILEISAKNLDTGKAEKAKLTLFGT